MINTILLELSAEDLERLNSLASNKTEPKTEAQSSDAVNSNRKQNDCDLQ